MIPLRVLFVEDDPADRLAFERFVEEHCLPITYALAGSLNEAKGLVGQGEFDLIVVDYSLGDGTALDFLPFAAGIPVILIAGNRDEEIAARALSTGISDSLVKDIGRHYLEQLPERMEKAVGRQLRSGEVLPKSEALYRRVVDTANEGIWIADSDYHTSFVNRRMAEMLGYEPAEMVGKPIQQFLFAEDLADFTSRTRTREQAVPSQYERRFRHKDGSARWAIISTTTTVDDQGESRGSFAMVTDITDRKRAEEALRESEAKYRLLADNTVDGVWLLDMNLKLIYCSPSSEKQSGFTLQEIMAMSLEQYFTPESLKTVMTAFLEEMPKIEADPDYNPIVTLDLEYYKKAGTAFWAESKFSVVRDQHGKPVSILAQARDITERKQLEKALRESEAKYRSLVETAVEGVASIDTNGNLTFINDALCRLMGYSQDELLNEPFAGILHPDDLPALMEAFLSEVAGTRTVASIEFRGIPKTGQSIWFSTQPTAIVVDGKTIGFNAILHDITERKREEEALKVSETKYRVLFESLPLGVTVSDKTGRIQEVNKEAERLLGLSQDTQTQRSIDDQEWQLVRTDGSLMPSDEYASVRALKENRTIENVEMGIAKGEGGITWINVTAAPIPLPEYGLVIAYSDISERKRAEEALRESKERLELALIGGDLGFYDWDLQTEEGYTDERYLGMLGYTPGEIDLGCRAKWERQVHPDDLGSANHPIQSDLWGETLTYDEEYRMRHKSGEWVWVRDRAQITARAADGRPLRITGTHENITERKRVEEALYFSNQRLELAQRSAGAGIWDWDMTRRHLDWSRELFLLFGLDPDKTEATFDIWHQVLHPDDREIASHRMDQAIEDRIPLINEYRVIHPDGQVRWIRALGNTIYDPSGQPLRMAGICIDVTERKQAEEKLRKSEALLEGVGEMAKVGGWELDVETKQVLWTGETYRIHEVPEGERIDLPQALLFFDLPERSALETALQHCMETGEGFDLELPFTSAKGSHLWTRALGRAVKSDGKVLSLTGTFQDITERRRAEEELRESKSSLQTILRSTADGLLALDRENQVLLANERFGEMWKIPQEVIICKDDAVLLQYILDQLIDPQDYQDKVQELSASEEESFDTLSLKDGRIFERLSRPLMLGAELRGRVWSFRDITERKQAEEILRESEERYRSLFEHMVDGYAYCKMLLDDQGHPVDFLYLDVNQAFKRMAGLENKEGKSVTEAIPGIREPYPEIFQSYGRVASTGTPEKSEIEFQPSNKWFSISVYSPARDYFVAVFGDITERRRAEEELRESKSSLQTILRSTADGLLALDRENQVLLANERFGEMWKIPQEVIICKDDAVLLQYILDQLIDPQGYLDKVQELSASEEESFDTLSLKDGRIFERLSRPLMLGAELRGRVWSFRDITERKYLEERIGQVRNDLLFAVSHDMKTPLMILNQSQEMLSALAPGEALTHFQEYRQIWRRNLQRLERMINNLVDSQRSEEGRFPLLLVPCRLEEIVQRVVEDLAGYALTFQVTFDLNLPSVPESSCDVEAIGRVVENLLTNAVKFSPKAGRVEVRLRMGDKALLLEVEDHGAGIPVNDQEQLFQPFHRGRSAQQKGIPGTGLGLYVCRRIMEAHGGSITLRSEEGKGTTVTVTLPLRE